MRSHAGAWTMKNAEMLTRNSRGLGFAKRPQGVKMKEVERRARADWNQLGWRSL